MRYKIRLSNYKPIGDEHMRFVRFHFYGTDGGCHVKRGYALSTGIKIHTDDWEKYSSGNYDPDETISHLNITFDAFSKFIAQIEALVAKEETVSRLPYILYMAKQSFLRCKDGNPVLNISKLWPTSICFTEYFLDFFRRRNTDEVKKNWDRDDISFNTYIKGMEKTYALLQSWEKVRKHHYTLDEIDGSFHESFRRWCLSKGRKKHDVDNDLVNVRRVMREAHKLRLTPNTDFRLTTFHIGRFQPNDLVFSAKMIQELIDFELTTREMLIQQILFSNLDLERKEELYRCVKTTRVQCMIRSRSIFLMSLYTGQSIVDCMTIRDDMIETHKGKRYMCITPKGCQEQRMIPMTEQIEKILAQNDGIMPKMRHGTVIKDIRFMAELLGWTWVPGREDVRIGHRTDTRLCDIINIWTPIQTYIVDAYNSGMPLHSILAITSEKHADFAAKYFNTNK